VRIDRDRLPHVDAKYQRAAPLVRSQGGGWPLTVLITPEGHTLFKATFLPPRPSGRYGARMGLIDVLERLDALWRENRDKINRAAEEMRGRAGEPDRAFARPGEPRAETIDQLVQGLLRAHDETHGGFGQAPKFFHAPALELLLARAWAGDDGACEALTRTLDAMAGGGVYDHVGGGWHRYSVDARWHVPHFEKMAYDNAPLLALYANAYARTGNDQYKRVARETLAWIARELAAPEGKGFYASQDADVGLDDDGDYFTWTPQEFHEAVGDDANIAAEYYAIDESGDVHGRPGRNVLHAPKTAAQVAGLLDVSESEVRLAVEGARNKLAAARAERTAPAVDETVFADLNGMLIDAHLTAYERLGEKQARDAALAALDHVLAELRDDRGVFAHYAEGGERKSPGLLADQAWMLRALVHAYGVTLESQYLEAARAAADYILSDLTADDGGFFSAPAPEADDPAAVAPRRSWEDSPSRSPASVAAEALVSLGHLTDEDRYLGAGRKAVESFAGGASADMALFVSGFGLALDQVLNGPRTVRVVGPDGDDATGELTKAARRAYVPSCLVLTIDFSAQAQAGLLSTLGYEADDQPVAYVCRGAACLAPAHTPEELLDRLDDLRSP
jgi:hypothetical protein